MHVHSNKLFVYGYWVTGMRTQGHVHEDIQYCMATSTLEHMESSASNWWMDYLNLLILYSLLYRISTVRQGEYK
jgi:hypothetical protein